jgi:hypothetical protein
MSQPINGPVGYNSRGVTVAKVTVVHLGLEYACLGAKSPLCIYKQREGNKY